MLMVEDEEETEREKEDEKDYWILVGSFCVSCVSLKKDKI